MTKQALAAALSISAASVDRLVRAQRIPFVRVGDVRRFDLAAVRLALENVDEVAEAAPRDTPVRLLGRRTR